MPDFSPGHRNVALEDLQPNTRPGSPHEGLPFLWLVAAHEYRAAVARDSGQLARSASL